MFPAALSNSTSLSEEASVSSVTRNQDFFSLNPVVSTISPQQQQQQQKSKKKRSLPGNPDPDAEVIALSPKTLLATNRFICEVCNKGFQRDQNLQLHRRGHNLPWKLKQRNSKEIRKRAYVCPEPTCVHHHPSRALGDLTGIKKHYCRKHGEKKWKCEKCSKIYAVQSDWKAHSKTCGTREYRCDCGTLFSRKDSFITHRAFCDALAEESARLSAHQLISTTASNAQSFLLQNHHFPLPGQQVSVAPWDTPANPSDTENPVPEIKPETTLHFQIPQPLQQEPHQTFASNKGLLPSTFQTMPNGSTTAGSHHLSATALLQKAANVSVTRGVGHSRMAQLDMAGLRAVSQVADPVSHISQLGNIANWQNNDRLTRDFLGLTGDHRHHSHRHYQAHSAGGNGNGNIPTRGGSNISMNMREMLTYTGRGVELQQYNGRVQTLLKPHEFGFAQTSASQTWGDC